MFSECEYAGDAGFSPVEMIVMQSLNLAVAASAPVCRDFIDASNAASTGTGGDHRR